MTNNAADSAVGRSLEERVQHVEDRIAVQDLIVRYGLGQHLHEDGDSNVLEQWDSVFASGATVDCSVTGDPALKGLDHRRLVEVMRGGNGTMSTLLKWQHFQGFSTVEIDGDTATARTRSGSGHAQPG